jgi:hypothetical protein
MELNAAPLAVMSILGSLAIGTTTDPDPAELAEIEQPA